MRSRGSHLLSFSGRSFFGPTWRASLTLALSLLLIAGSVEAPAQSSAPPSSPQTAPAQEPQNQNIPDAPSTVQPSQPPPENAPPQAAPGPEMPKAAQPGSGANPNEQGNAPASQSNPGPKPPINIRTVPEGGATQEAGSAQDQLFTITKNVNQVLVPVTVKDESGHLVNGLVPKEFTVVENGQKQTLNFFTSDPFALSAAVVLDLGMKDVDLQKVNHTFPSLEGAFSPFDEISLYTYSNAVTQLSGWGAVGQKLSAALDDLRRVRGENNGPPITGGPLGPQGPMINNRPVDPAAPTVYTP
ncbi:MAG TPA: hypothetical protein VGU90_11265, partial [Terriglobales bacterium]|nr:hypothetical protein [Terriglobales bacterium]